MFVPGDRSLRQAGTGQARWTPVVEARSLNAFAITFADRFPTAVSC